MIGIIGGSGVQSLPELTNPVLHQVSTPYGDADISVGGFSGVEVAFLARHGSGHSIAPHAINYRANLWALQSLGVENIIALNAVGSIRESLKPGHIVIPDQLIDYTWGRESTFYDGLSTSVSQQDGTIAVKHIDFSLPYDEPLRARLADCLLGFNDDCATSGVYGCTQGPRLETAAEVQRLKRDGCDLVGMTGMPEAALARELDIAYVSLCLVVNPAAGITDAPITLDDIMAVLDQGVIKLRRFLSLAVPKINDNQS